MALEDAGQAPPRPRASTRLPDNPSLKKRIVPTEHEEQKHLVKWLKIQGFVFHSTPNEHAGGYRTVAKLRVAGMQPGFPDLTILGHPVRRCPVFHVEMKRSNLVGRKNGGLSDNQMLWQRTLAGIGQVVLVSHGWQDAVRRINTLLAETCP